MYRYGDLLHSENCTELLACYKIDTNECIVNNGDCSQMCTNSNGSYACICNSGYLLALDNRTCAGTSTTKEEYSALSYHALKTLMNVQHSTEIAIKSASILLEVMSAHVVLGINLIIIMSHAMVSPTINTANEVNCFNVDVAFKM